MKKPKCRNAKCRKQFTPKTDWQKFCSDACRIADFKAAQPRKPKPYSFS